MSTSTLRSEAKPAPEKSPTNKLLHGPLLPTLIKLALPTVIVLFMTNVLSVAETYFVSSLGLDAIAAASLVVPVVLLMTMVSSGGIGGGVSSAIARALGARRQEEAESLVWHTVVIAAVAGGLFTIVLLTAGPTIYRALGGTGRALEQAILYSNILFLGAVPLWILMLLQAALRGSGNVKVPALIMLGGVAGGLILSPILITGMLGFPQMGVAGAGIAQVLCNLVALGVVVSYMRKEGSALKLRRVPLKAEHFKAILNVGLLSSVNAIMSALSVTALTAAAGATSVAAIAGFGIASRLDVMLVPVMFGFGTAAITLVGTNLGAGNETRARDAAKVNILFVASVVGLVGMVVAILPNLWLDIFTKDQAIKAVGAQYLHIIGPFYAILGVIFELYFAAQGAQKLLWPMVASVVRFIFALVATALVISHVIELPTAFALVAMSFIVAATISFNGFLRTDWKR